MAASSGLPGLGIVEAMSGRARKKGDSDLDLLLAVIIYQVTD
jgi:hypothetical protein